MLVELRNVHPDRPYTLVHAKHEPKGFTIKPGGRKITHFDVAALYLGNPAARNVGEAVDQRKRDAELTRVQVLWGFYAGLAPDEAWEAEARPRIECYLLDEDSNAVRMWMVHDDPTGERRVDGSLPEPSGVEIPPAIAAQMAEQRQEIRELKDMLAAFLTSATAAGVEPEAPPPGSIAAQLGAALDTDQTQAERNAERDDIPPPPPPGPVGKDRPRTPRTGR